MKYYILAGHGKNTKGKRSPNLEIGFLEYEHNRLIAHGLEYQLQLLGIDCEFVNPGPIEISLNDKVRFLNYEHARNDICSIAIHSNAMGAGKWHTASGSRIFIPKQPWMPKKLKLWKVSRDLGRSIQNSFIDSNTVPYHSRPMLESGLWMVHKPKCPCVLIEYGFHTNKQDVVWMKSEQGQRQIVKTITEGVVFFNDRIVK